MKPKLLTALAAALVILPSAALFGQAAYPLAPRSFDDDDPRVYGPLREQYSNSANKEVRCTHFHGLLPRAYRRQCKSRQPDIHCDCGLPAGTQVACHGSHQRRPPCFLEWPIAIPDSVIGHIQTGGCSRRV